MYLEIKKMSAQELLSLVPRVFFFAGKAAPSYTKAKLVIQLISCVSDVINNDMSILGLLTVVFIPNYNVSLAELIIPASDVSQHISTSGTEASGTSNIKFAMNAGIILGTLDGANVEMREAMGEENMFVFGAKAEEVSEIRRCAPWIISRKLFEVCRSIRDCKWADYQTTQSFVGLITDIEAGHDHYLVGYDFQSYVQVQEKISRLWKEKSKWYKMAIMSMVGMCKFSTDRTITEYSEDIWKIKPCRVPEQVKNGHGSIDPRCDEI
eukprot:TRINITY_DN6607_c0_g1_i5.p1 TRINITY_DN6607_c0_g1~~TRINITY_DN6607_c0_g1_i5.p1  ORF type:complete len:266 (-),score=41.94 TRINITY_DN6607_c0_g1_i5:130-927(-)